MTGSPESPIGLTGLGRMGSAIAHRLLDAGYELWVHNRSPERAEALLQRGAHWAESPAHLARDVGFIMSMVSDDRALEAVALGPDGVLSGALPGLVYADMGTISAGTSAAVARTAEQAGVGFLRAPVSGSTVLAQDGALGVLVSGPRDAFEACRETFSTLGSNVFYLGADEEARVMKLALNTLVAISVTALTESLVLGSRNGLDPKTMLEVFGNSAVGSPVVRYKSAPLAERDFTPAFSTAMMKKDLDLALDLARECDAPMPSTSQCRELLQATIGLGWGEDDFASTLRLFEALSGRDTSTTDGT